jgi:hypothetical protein
MRQIFSSPRLENVEAVAQMLTDAGIEVRITDGRTYKGALRGNFRYSDDSQKRPAVWVIKSEDQLKARELLRENGLIDTTRGDSAYTLPVFRTEEQTRNKTPQQKRMFRIKMGLLGGIVIVLAMTMIRTISDKPTPAPAPPALATGPFDGSVAPTLAPIAQAVFSSQLAEANVPVLCLAVDGKDAPAAMINALKVPGRTLVPASQCRRVADSDTGSFHMPTGQPAMMLDVNAFRPSAPDAGQVEYSAYHHRMFARYKTLEVKRINGVWQVTRVLKHVAT